MKGCEVYLVGEDDECFLTGGCKIMANDKIRDYDFSEMDADELKTFIKNFRIGGHWQKKGCLASDDICHAATTELTKRTTSH